MEGTDVFEEKLAGLLEEAKKKKNVLEYQEVMNYFGQEPPVSNQLDRLFEFLDQNKVDVIRMGTEDELDPDPVTGDYQAAGSLKAAAHLPGLTAFHRKDGPSYGRDGRV